MSWQNVTRTPYKRQQLALYFRVSRSYLILFYPISLAQSYFVLFVGNVLFYPIFLAILPLILAFYGLFITISRKDIPKKIFSLTSLSMKIFYAHIILQSIPFPAITAKRPLIERRGIIIVLNVKEMAKIPQEVTELIFNFS